MRLESIRIYTEMSIAETPVDSLMVDKNIYRSSVRIPTSQQEIDFARACLKLREVKSPREAMTRSVIV